jgi:hypothetical protein
MTVSADEIERIVRDVMSRLASERPAAAKPGNEAKEAETPKPAAATVGELVLETKVVTLAEVQGRLVGIKQLSVVERAIITPAVRDLLRDKKVGLVRRAAGTQAGGVASGRTIVVAAVDAKTVVAGLVRDLRSQGCKLEELAQAGLAAAVRELGDEVAKSGAIGLLVCDEPEAALIALNRRSGIRAVGGDDVASIERSAKAVGANAFVVRGSKVGGLQVKRWLAAAARQATSVPTKLTELLK